MNGRPGSHDGTWIQTSKQKLTARDDKVAEKNEGALETIRYTSQMISGKISECTVWFETVDLSNPLLSRPTNNELTTLVL
jgi:hypothetical protein